MNIKSSVATALIPGLVLVMLFAPAALGQEQPTTPVIIPPQVKAVFTEGMQTRVPREDIPFQITDTLFLPAQLNMHAVFFFKIKNADLGFAPPAAPAQEQPQQEQPAEPKLVAQVYTFLQFNKLEDSTPGEVAKEVYIPLILEEDPSTYNPEKVETYSTGYPLPPGKYLLSMAITSQDFQKIGTQYFEFSLPDPLSFTDTLGTTPIFLAKKFTQMAAPETRAEIHKDYFTYSILQIEPNLDRVIAPKEFLDIFFYIFGAKANEEGKTDINIHYEVFKGDELVINFENQPYDAPLVSQQLPMKKTVLIRTTKGTETTERTERRDLEPGKYTLSIDIKDNLSGKSLKKSLDFEIR